VELDLGGPVVAEVIDGEPGRLEGEGVERVGFEGAEVVEGGLR
jgi:hypothetical protein